MNSRVVKASKRSSKSSIYGPDVTVSVDEEMRLIHLMVAHNQVEGVLLTSAQARRIADALKDGAASLARKQG